MFLKLIKNEFKSSIKNYLIVYIAFIASAIFSAICISLNFNVPLMVICLTTVYISLIALLVVSFINIVKMSSKDMYDSQGFLTFSLPVSSHQLVLSKIVVSIIYTIFTYLTIYIADYIFVIILKPENISYIFQSIFSLPVPYTIISMIWNGVSIIQFICLLQLVNSLGNSSFIKKKSSGKTVLLYFAIVLVINILTIILRIIIPYDLYFFINAEGGELMYEITNMGESYNGSFSLFVLILNIGLSVLYYFLTIYNLNKKLDL